MQMALENRSDWELLQEYAGSGSEPAFAALVNRHVNFVYSVAFRQCSDHRLAEEIANDVFLVLARKARTLKQEIALPGWLFKAARYVASNARGFESRRRKWEQEAAQMGAATFPSASTSAEGEVAKAWEIVAEQLDLAVGELGEADRNAILLRFYESKSLREIGADFGISEEAARKRTARALEKLRILLAQRGVACPIAALGLALSTYAAQAAPVGLATSIAGCAGNLPAGDISIPDKFFEESFKHLRLAPIKYAAMLGLTAGLIASATLMVSYLGLVGPGPREIFLRQAAARSAGDGEAFVQTLHFNTPEEQQTGPLFVDSIRVGSKLRTALVKRFGQAAFSQSQFPGFLDLFDTNRVAELKQSIHGRQATLVLPWGPRLPFVKERGEWKLDYFRISNRLAPASYRAAMISRNVLIDAAASEVEAGRFNSVQEAHTALQNRIERATQ